MLYNLGARGILFCWKNKWSLVKKIWDRLHHRKEYSLGKFNVTFDCVCSQPIGMLVNSTWGNSDIRATKN